MMLTVFTPTYNRGYILYKLYDSLCRQTNNNFEWLIVDDGSQDDTDAIVSSFIAQHVINIRYFKQANGGKHRAINRGVQESNSKLFFIVDSDDQLLENAVERVLYYYHQIEFDTSFAGISGIKAYFSGNNVGGELSFNVLDCTAIDFRYKYHIRGDMAEVFRTEILKRYPFPEIEREKFCPEVVIWNRIALQYKLRFFNEKIYLCDYLEDGLTAKIVKIRMDSPKASMICYSELFKIDIPIFSKLKAAINYWRFACCSKVSFVHKVKQIGFLSLSMYPLGVLYHLRDLRS